MQIFYRAKKDGTSPQQPSSRTVPCPEFKQQQLTRSRRAGSTWLEAPLGPLNAKNKTIDGHGFLREALYILPKLRRTLGGGSLHKGFRVYSDFHHVSTGETFAVTVEQIWRWEEHLSFGLPGRGSLRLNLDDGRLLSSFAMLPRVRPRLSLSLCVCPGRLSNILPISELSNWFRQSKGGRKHLALLLWNIDEASAMHSTEVVQPQW